MLHCIRILAGVDTSPTVYRIWDNGIVTVYKYWMKHPSVAVHLDWFDSI